MGRLFVVLGIVVGGLIALVKWLPWWGSLLALGGLAIGAKFMAGSLLKRFIMGAFKAKSAALAGAQATLHGVQRVGPPKPDEGDDPDDVEMPEEPVEWVQLDVTVHVPEDNGAKTPFRYWDPYELSIVPPDAKPGLHEEDGDDGLGHIAGVEVFHEGEWLTVEGKLPGTQRLRIHAGVPPETRYFKLRYYFEIIENRETR
jgi:hypothetical protein